ncbi:Meiotic recombination protein [Yarrowia sp. C11]|nr:Meiotic recombination protein [Yarrowia sp. C11]
MFFSTTLFEHQPGLSTVWLLATVNKTPQRRDILDLEINHICKEISRPANPMALRLSSQLMYGTVVAMSRQSSSLQADVNSLRNRLNFAPLAPRSIDLPERRAMSRPSLVLEDVAVLPCLPLPDLGGVIDLPQLNLPDLITPEVSWVHDEDDDLGDLDISFDENGLLTDNLNIDDFVLEDLGQDFNPEFEPQAETAGMMTPSTPRSPHTPLPSSPFRDHDIVPVDDLATIQEATQVVRRKRVRAAVWEDEISLKMADLRGFRDNYLDNMAQQKSEQPQRRKRRKTKFSQWKDSVVKECEHDPILLLEKEIEDMLKEPVPVRQGRVARPAVEVGRGTPVPPTPGSIEIARRGSAATSPWSDHGEARMLGSSGMLGSRVLGSAGTPGSGRARHSRRGGLHSRSGSFGDVDFPDEYPDAYFPDDIPGDDYHMLSGSCVGAHEAQEFLFHLMSVCQGKTSFETVVPSTLSEGVPNDRATAATSFAKALDLATKGVVRLTGGGKPDGVFLELT